MSEWTFPYIFSYWDQLTGIINKSAMRLHELDAHEREKAYADIREAMETHIQRLTDEQFMKAALSLIDDLYKYVNDEIYCATELVQYLDAFGRTFTTRLREKGYSIQYVVENTFANDFLMVGPFDLFPVIFNAIGLVYVCPQLIAWDLMKHDGLEAAAYPLAISRYTMEARKVADDLLQRCHADHAHYIFLETDYQDGCLDAALRERGTAGVLSIFRNQAAVADSTVVADLQPIQR
jgi:hypothetical protein